MAKPNYAFEKRQRELDKKRKKAEKASKKTEPQEPGAPEGESQAASDSEPPAAEPAPQDKQ